MDLVEPAVAATGVRPTVAVDQPGPAPPDRRPSTAHPGKRVTPEPTDDVDRSRPRETVTTFIWPLGVAGKRMTPGLSDSDWDRIRQFAEKSLYDRNPDMLVPVAEDDDLE